MSEISEIEPSIIQVARAYQGSDGNATKALYARLENLGTEMLRICPQSQEGSLEGSLADRFPRPGESVDDWLDRTSREDRENLRAMLIEANRLDILAQYGEQMRLLDLGVTGARMCWHSISTPQRRALAETAKYGGRLERIGKEYRHRDRHQPYRPIYLRTVRNLCARELLAWDGGIADPESAAVVTERGLFVLKHGPVEDADAR